MKKYRNLIILANLVGIALFFILAVQAKEKTLKEGTLVLLELAPVDPRSLMQGDYMRLNYAISNSNSNSFFETETPEISKRGFVVLTLDSLGVGQSVRLQETFAPIEAKELAIKYFKPDWRIHIGAESYFFQEGQAEKFEAAKYGGLRVDEKGNSILIGLYDADRKRIE